jgi:hypothetical protein
MLYSAAWYGSPAFAWHGVLDTYTCKTPSRHIPGLSRKGSLDVLRAAVDVDDRRNQRFSGLWKIQVQTQFSATVDLVHDIVLFRDVLKIRWRISSLSVNRSSECKDGNNSHEVEC